MNTPFALWGPPLDSLASIDAVELVETVLADASASRTFRSERGTLLTSAANVLSADSSYRDAESARYVIGRLDDLVATGWVTPTPDEYWMSIAFAAASRSRSARRRVGAALILGAELLGVGSNEVPGLNGGLAWEDHGDSPGEVDESLNRKDYVRGLIESALASSRAPESTNAVVWADLSGRLLPLLDIDRSVHAEAAAVLSCARRGIAVENAELYTTLEPCYRCMRTCLTAGVKKITYLEAADSELDPVLRERLVPPLQVRQFSGLHYWKIGGAS